MSVIPKVIWKVSDKPTGRFRSFESRAWPSAEYSDGKAAAYIVCEDEYIPANVKTGDHRPLKIQVADYSVTPWRWRNSKNYYITLEAAKAGFDKILRQHPEIIPKSISDNLKKLR